MKNNNATPKLDVDPQTYEVFVDGEKSPVRRQQNYHLLKDTSYSRRHAQMIIEEIQGNIANLSPEEKQKHVEKVYLENSDLVKRIQRVTTDHGNEIGIRLKQPIDLQYGDILFQDDKNMIIVDVNSEDLLVIKPRNLKEMGDIAHQLGNRHLPCSIYRN